MRVWSVERVPEVGVGSRHCTCILLNGSVSPSELGEVASALCAVRLVVANKEEEEKGGEEDGVLEKRNRK